jgi:hypothetical protein
VREETISVHPTFASLLSKLAAAWSEIQETIILRWLANLLSNTCYNFSSPNQLLSFFSVLLIQEIIISIINHPEKLMMTKGINITRQAVPASASLPTTERNDASRSGWTPNVFLVKSCARGPAPVRRRCRPKLFFFLHGEKISRMQQCFGLEVDTRQRSSVNSLKKQKWTRPETPGRRSIFS